MVSTPKSGLSAGACAAATVPAHHQPADGRVAAILAKLLHPSGEEFLSLNDFGAGVGQYGHALRSKDAGHRWHGFDGAGNVGEVTSNMVCAQNERGCGEELIMSLLPQVSWFDLTFPNLSLPVAD